MISGDAGPGRVKDDKYLKRIAREKKSLFTTITGRFINKVLK
jgi:hypothetical protein